MADIKLKDAAAASTVASTGLNSLANGSLAAGSAIANGTDLDLACDFELLTGTFGGSVAQFAKVAELYLVPTVDGTNYADGYDASVRPQAAFFVGGFERVTAAGTGGVRLILCGIPLPPRSVIPVLKNTSGQTFASSGNTLKVRAYKLQSA